MTLEEIRAGLLAAGKVTEKIEWTERFSHMPELHIRRWSLPLFQRIAKAWFGKEDIAPFQNEGLVDAVCAKDGTKLFKNEADLISLVDGLSAEFVFARLLTYNGFTFVEDKTDKKEATNEDSKNLPPTETSGSLPK